MSVFSNSHLASTIIWWLNYTSSVGREYIIAESAIKIPATEYLERYYRDYIQLEYNHPYLNQKRFDLFYNDVTNGIETAFEFKFIKGDSTRALGERKRIFNDLMRLNLFIDTNKRSYFLICGNILHFNTSFQNLKLKPKLPILTKTIKSAIPTKSGYYGEWFSFDISNPQKIIDLNNVDRQYRSIYNAFMKDYSKSYKVATSNNLIKPKSIETKLIFLSEELSAPDIPQTFKIGVWELIK
jgi:hypothetical protein